MKVILDPCRTSIQLLIYLRMILNKLSIGQSGRLSTPSQNTPDLKRLQELGFVAGAWVKLLRKGPLGSPLLFEICQTKIAIRSEEAAFFEVN